MRGLRTEDSWDSQVVFRWQCGLEHWGKTTSQWYRRQGPSLDIPSVDLDQYFGTARHSFKRASEVFQDRAFLQRWGFPDSEDMANIAANMPGGGDAVMRAGEDFQRQVRHCGAEGRAYQDALAQARQSLEAARAASLSTASEAPGWMQNFHKEIMAGQAVAAAEQGMMKADIARISTHQEVQDKRMSDLERQMRDLRSNPPSTASASTSGGFGTGPGANPLGGGGGQRLSWHRSFVELTGWTQWNGSTLQRSQSMMRDSDAAQLITNIRSILPNEIDSRFDAMGTLRLNGSRMMLSSVKMKFTAGTEDSVFWEIKQLLEDAFTPDNTRTPQQTARSPPTRASMFANMTATPATVRVRLEAPPWKKDHIWACGRFCGTWRGKIGNNPAMDIKAETGSGNGTSTIWTKPADASRRPVEVAVFKVTTGNWEVHRDIWDGTIKHNTNITCTYDDFTAALNSSR